MKRHTFPPRKIVVATDLGPASRAAMGFAKVLHTHFGSEVTVLHACHLDLPPYFSSGQMDALKREVERAKHSAEGYVRKESRTALGFEAGVAVIDKPPLDAILEESSRLGAELVVMGTHGRRGARRLMLGSVAERVLRHSSVPVLVVREAAAAGPFKHVFCPCNSTVAGKTALEYAADVAQAADAQLTVLHAGEKEAGQSPCGQIEESLRKRCRVNEVRAGGEAVEVILESARQAGPDLIVMAAESRVSIVGELFSSTIERVMQLTEVPLLVVPKL